MQHPRLSVNVSRIRVFSLTVFEYAVCKISEPGGQIQDSPLQRVGD